MFSSVSFVFYCTVGALCSPYLGPSGRPVDNNSSRKNLPTEVSVMESFVQRTLVRSGIVELSDLCIQEGKSAWKSVVSIVCLNHDGIEDASLLY
jgi:exosome complex RNA-binding protein Rrp42 (RNase PH superfamily)